MSTTTHPAMNFPYLNDTSEALEMQAEMRAEFVSTIKSGLNSWHYVHEPHAPIQTYGEWKALMDRAMNPTPADVAAKMLNGEQPSVGQWHGAWSGTPEWLEIRRAARNVKRQARAYVRFA